MARLDVPTPAGECGYAYVAPDADGVPVWRRCNADLGHSGVHRDDLSLEARTIRDATDAHGPYVGAHTTEPP